MLSCSLLLSVSVCAMAETSICPPIVESEIAVLKDALRTQQQLLQKLYVELDEEREASATAANEALSMILRLQGERAAEKMEAHQYKRMAEEKMHHVEETLEDFEAIMYQKEMEIASLGFQVQAHRYKLLSMGFGDLCTGETRYSENFFERQSESYFGDMGLFGTVKRNNSPLAIRFKDSYYWKGIAESEGSETPLSGLAWTKLDEDMVCGFDVQNLNIQKKCKEPASEHVNSYWEQIKDLDERVKQLSDSRHVDMRVNSDFVSRNQGLQSTNSESSLKLNAETEACSLQSRKGRNLLHNPTGRAKETDVNSGWNFSCASSKATHHENLLQTDASGNSAKSTNVYDIFEVPKIHDKYKSCEPREQEHNMLILESENRLGKPDSVHQGTADYCVKDKTDWIKTMIQYEHCKNESSKARDGGTVDCHLALVGPQVGDTISEPEIQQLNSRLMMLEDGVRIIKNEAAASKEEGLNLLREICEQLTTIKSEIRNLKYEQSPPADETPILLFKEAMLFFWL